MIKNRIYKSELIDWSKVKDLQPENAKLHYNISYLRNSILKYGIAKAYDVCELDGCLYWLDGHTRTDMLRTLESEGIKIPKLLMGNFCNVESRKEAIEILIEVHNQKHNPFNENVLMEWIEIESVEVNIESVNIDEIRYSEKNKEIDIDGFDANMTIKLTYTEEEYWKVKEQLSKIDNTPEIAIWKLLGND